MKPEIRDDRGLRMMPPGKKNMIRRKKQMYLQNTSEDFVQLSLKTQDDAVIVSANFRFHGIRQEISRIFREEMETLSQDVENSGGLVGHIKASLDFKEVEIYSVTGSHADIRKGDRCDVSGSFAAILLLTDETNAYTKTDEMFRRIKEKVKYSRNNDMKKEDL